MTIPSIPGDHHPRGSSHAERALVGTVQQCRIARSKFTGDLAIPLLAAEVKFHTIHFSSLCGWLDPLIVRADLRESPVVLALRRAIAITVAAQREKAVCR